MCCCFFSTAGEDIAPFFITLQVTVTIRNCILNYFDTFAISPLCWFLIAYLLVLASLCPCSFNPAHWYFAGKERAGGAEGTRGGGRKDGETPEPPAGAREPGQKIKSRNAAAGECHRRTLTLYLQSNDNPWKTNSTKITFKKSVFIKPPATLSSVFLLLKKK